MKITFKKEIIFLFFLFLVPAWAIAQTVTVRGTIKDTQGETLLGVNVLEVGTTNGTITNFDGKYEIKVARNASLVFTYIGYKSKTIQVKGQQTINVVLESDVLGLDEVVVVGYGTMKKSDLTGAVVSVTSDAVSKSIPTSVDQILQGRAAGVQVQQNSGMPGASTSIRIRGISSLNASNEPIYVIDGVVIDGGSMNGAANTNTNALASINPSDIVSMDILKDASATAIYGSRASNGVIMITTKRGTKGEASISYNGYMG
ncbi:MAG: TonB-dependent receptor plug domain-containing protein, partial [Paludibacter sp.]